MPSLRKQIVLFNAALPSWCSYHTSDCVKGKEKTADLFSREHGHCTGKEDKGWLTRKIILQLPSDRLRTPKSELWQFKQHTRETSKARVSFHILSLHELKILKESSSRQGCICLAEKQTESLFCSACTAFPQYFVSTWVKLRAHILIAW